MSLIRCNCSTIVHFSILDPIVMEIAWKLGSLGSLKAEFGKAVGD